MVQFHAPIYHTYYTHYKEMECFASLYEPLFLSHGVDLVINGHVHAYERTHPMYQYRLHPCGPIYLTLGDAGNTEGPYRSGVEEPLDPTGAKTNLTYCELLTSAAGSALDVGISPVYQRMVHPPDCPATSLQKPYGARGEPAGLVPNRQDPSRFWCQKSLPKWSARRSPAPPLAQRTVVVCRCSILWSFSQYCGAGAMLRWWSPAPPRLPPLCPARVSPPSESPRCQRSVPAPHRGPADPCLTLLIAAILQ